MSPDVLTQRWPCPKQTKEDPRRWRRRLDARLRRSGFRAILNTYVGCVTARVRDGRDEREIAATSATSERPSTGARTETDEVRGEDERKRVGEKLVIHRYTTHNIHLVKKKAKRRKNGKTHKWHVKEKGNR